MIAVTGGAPPSGISRQALSRRTSSVGRITADGSPPSIAPSSSRTISLLIRGYGCLIVVSGVWRFYRDEYYKGPHWDLGPGYYESFFSEKGPDDVVSSFQAIALT